MESSENATLLAKAAGGDLAPNGVVIVSNLQLASLVFCLAVALLASHRLDLGVEWKLAVAAGRCLVQLSALGLVLVPIIMYNYPPVVLAYITLMMLVAAVEASARPPYAFDAMVVVCFISITTTVALFGVFTFTVVLGTGLDAQYCIPIIGMITGQSMSSLSVALSNIVTEFAERKSNIENLLALGASKWEASYDILRSSVLLGLTPTLNTMSVTGLVSIPGMMTGQIIGGTPPSLAAKYQLVIMYVASGTATISTLTASVLTVYTLIDSQNRVRGEKLYPRAEVNRLESIITTARYLASFFTNWQATVRRQSGPFPPYVHDPIPATQIAVAAESEVIPGSRTPGEGAKYGSMSSQKRDEENG